MRIYDSAKREIRDFEPVEAGKASIYICGLTVQGSPHIGHIRFTVAFDQLRRWLTAGHGLDVTLVRNVTDIEDKIIKKAKRNKTPWWAWAYKHELETSKALDALGVIPATYEPRATGHIGDMCDIIDALIEKGHAYIAEDGSGDVYFDVHSWDRYGELTGQKLEDLASAGDGGDNVKRSPQDFALWKGRPEGADGGATFPSPYGWGRPGWHIECSAMARKFLGETFDIHGGGVDLRFPHHENEQAQSCAAGFDFAQYWMHNGWVTMSGEKMSKSLGNSVLVLDMIKTTRPLVLRYYLGAAHYRSTIEYSPESLAEAETAIGRIEGFLARAKETLGVDTFEVNTDYPEKFRACMDDDLNVSGALAVIFDTVRHGNTALDQGDNAAVQEAATQIVSMTDILGVNPLDDHWAGNNTNDDNNADALDALIQERIKARMAARASKDYAAADQIRDELAAAGIQLEDTPDGARWRLERSN